MLPRDPVIELQVPYEKSYDHGALTTTTTVRIDKIPAGKRVRIEDVRYINTAGLTGDNTNAFSLEVMKNGTTQACLVFNTDTNDVPAGATLAADTWLIPALNATDANLVLDSADTLDLVFTKDGTQTLPVGRIVVRGRYV